ncbi:HD domain-containing protein [Nostoc cycadae]|uniref:HD-CE domain-containing protein n=1 Tax=Nostoc cycadae WK-1 TaxID=1861711 RepID=A0A2H6LGB3_9NOSO|nr:ATP-binding protein [Nostoc cycadae]GBE92260.1 hypothetical protein NCWK1_2014 [Nostoc cycadae WK-1]
MALQTEAERQADKVRELSEFSNLSLPGVREQVTEMLRLIGHEGIFATYTKHDISHIDFMLRMLDWLIPKETSTKMTPADWLLVVLSIYLHDLGMLVTTEEYQQRKNNEEFQNWLKSLERTNEGREYLIARTHRMTDDEKERFFFQEYIRKGHAARIREWITGNHSRKWGSQINAIAKELEKLLSPLPIRFREYLGTVCESHHADDLDKYDKYPLFALCGATPPSGVNVQYAGILLRTVDLLHVTQDRTPSVMFQTIRLSDPKGVSEWDRQLGTFAVYHINRTFELTDPDSCIVKISANFREEAPLFALQEYITYANKQIFQSKRWAEKSQQERDGKDYIFPWHTVKGDVQLEGVPPSPLKFELDRGRLLNLLVGHTIYNDATVAIRELLQNSIDAVRFQHHLDIRKAREKGQTTTPPIGTVRVRWKPDNRQLIVEDDGIGMDKDIIENHLMMVGSSYYNTSQFESDFKDFTPISRFGIGVLTCFMVSDDIEIVTCRDRKGHRIRMTSVDTDYLLREIQPDDQLLEGLEPHGTRVTLRLRETVDLSKKTIEEIVRYWIILPACRVEFVDATQEPQQIGFNSPEEALRYFHTDQLKAASLEDEASGKKLDVIVKKRCEQGEDRAGQYELAFAVNSNLWLERSFAQRPEKELPAVCIEGIRVSNGLPWFSYQSNLYSERSISAILSVRNDRRFRTTVSRAGLEKDEEFERIGQLCADMLFEHLTDEIKRISDKPGQPLSQASSASSGLYRNILKATNAGSATQYIESLYLDSPSIVIEKLNDELSSNNKTSRSLVSHVDLQAETEFWTVESRLVDSLGTISRDLGRELSLNEFIVALAPGYKELQFTPLVPDAHLFSEVILNSHRPELAKFSRQHQQTAIKWIRRTSNDINFSINVINLLSENFVKDIAINYIYTDQERRKRNPFFENLIKALNSKELFVIPMDIVKISGDDNQVQMVQNRITTMIKQGSDLEKLWSTFKEALLYLKNQKPDTIDLLRAASAVYSFSLNSHLKRKVYYSSPSAESYIFAWKDGVDILRSAFRDINSNIDLPDSINKLVAHSHIFNASNYWRDWFNIY